MYRVIAPSTWKSWPCTVTCKCAPSSCTVRRTRLPSLPLLLDHTSEPGRLTHPRCRLLRPSLVQHGPHKNEAVRMRDWALEAVATYRRRERDVCDYAGAADTHVSCRACPERWWWCIAWTRRRGGARRRGRSCKRWCSSRACVAGRGCAAALVAAVHLLSFLVSWFVHSFYRGVFR
jgi:hypothetical protein